MNVPIEPKMIESELVDKNGVKMHIMDPSIDNRVFEQRNEAKDKVFNLLNQTNVSMKDLVGQAVAGPGAQQNFEEFRCPICMCLVYQPMQCQACQNKMICKPCIDQGNIKSCPMCKKWGHFKEP